MKKPSISYPCTWSYCTIGIDRTVMIKEIPLKLGTIPHTISPGKTSRAGNYCSLNIDATVRSETERLSIITLLKSIPGVKVVL